MKNLFFAILLVLAPLCASAGNVGTVINLTTDKLVNNQPVVVSDGVGGACFIRSGGVVHQTTLGQEIFPAEATSLACQPDAAIFSAPCPAGDQRCFYNGTTVIRQSFGGGLPQVQPTWTGGLVAINANGLLGQGNRIVFSALDGNGNATIMERGSNGSVAPIAGLGRFGGFDSRCVTATDYFGIVNVGNLTQVFSIGTKGVSVVFSAVSAGNGKLACSGKNPVVAYQNGAGQLVVTEDLGKTSYTNALPGTLKSLAVSQDGGTIAVVVEDLGNKLYQLNAGIATRLPDPALALSGLPISLAFSGLGNDLFVVTYYTGRGVKGGR